jgi:hypothetical protein
MQESFKRLGKQGALHSADFGVRKDYSIVRNRLERILNMPVARPIEHGLEDDWGTGSPTFPPVPEPPAPWGPTVPTLGSGSRTPTSYGHDNPEAFTSREHEIRARMQRLEDKLHKESNLNLRSSIPYPQGIPSRSQSRSSSRISPRPSSQDMHHELKFRREEEDRLRGKSKQYEGSTTDSDARERIEREEEFYKKKSELRRLKDRIDREEPKAQRPYEEEIGKRHRSQNIRDATRKEEMEFNQQERELDNLLREARMRKERMYLSVRRGREFGPLSRRDTRSHSASEVEISYHRPSSTREWDYEVTTRGFMDDEDDQVSPAYSPVEQSTISSRSSGIVNDDIDELLRAWTTDYDDGDSY